MASALAAPPLPVHVILNTVVVAIAGDVVLPCVGSVAKRVLLAESNAHVSVRALVHESRVVLPTRTLAGFAVMPADGIGAMGGVVVGTGVGVGCPVLF